MMRMDVITLLPDMFQALDYGVVGRAKQRGIFSLQLWNPRDYTTDPHRRVDDRPYGGGPGMVMQTEPLLNTLKAIKVASPRTHVIYLSPQGKTLTQNQLHHWQSQYNALTFLCGRYEGIDERLIEQAIDEECSIGDYVLSGGELAAMVIIDGLARGLPGTLGDEDSSKQDSFSTGLLDHPHYTRPEEFANKGVPDVLLRGNHQAILRWRKKQALGRTWLRRPDLLAQYPINPEEQALLDEFIKEHVGRGNRE